MTLRNKRSQQIAMRTLFLNVSVVNVQQVSIGLGLLPFVFEYVYTACTHRTTVCSFIRMKNVV